MESLHPVMPISCLRVAPFIVVVNILAVRGWIDQMTPIWIEAPHALLQTQRTAMGELWGQWVFEHVLHVSLIETWRCVLRRKRRRREGSSRRHACVVAVIDAEDGVLAVHGRSGFRVDRESFATAHALALADPGLLIAADASRSSSSGFYRGGSLGDCWRLGRN